MDKWLAKGLSVFIITLVLYLSTTMILNMIEEREAYQETVIQDVARSTSGSQRVVGPVLVIPYTIGVDVTEVTELERGESMSSRRRSSSREYTYYMLPQDLKIQANAQVVPRKLGVYQAQVYTSTFSVSGSFEAIDSKVIAGGQENIIIGKPYLVFSISDTRGVLNSPTLVFNGKEMDFKPGVVRPEFMSGLHVPISAGMLSSAKDNTFNFDIVLQGSENLSVVPIGRNTTFALQSNWPHPSFVGDTLPQGHEITSAGFNAHWQSSWLANNINDKFGLDTVPDFSRLNTPTFSVKMIETVDQYQLNARSVKYAILFIGLTFIGFIVFELQARLRIHPIQYLLVGAALVMFYLLLLALSEQIGFGKAYAVAALASCGLIGVYLCSILKGLKRGAGFTIGLLLLYGLLYIILNSEGMALLFGSVLLFVVLAIIMLVTRKVDWYEVMNEGEVLSEAMKYRKDKSAKARSQTSFEQVRQQPETAKQMMTEKDNTGNKL